MEQFPVVQLFHLSRFRAFSLSKSFQFNIHTFVPRLFQPLPFVPTTYNSLRVIHIFTLHKKSTWPYHLSRPWLTTSVVVTRRSRTASCPTDLTINTVLRDQSTWDATWDAVAYSWGCQSQLWVEIEAIYIGSGRPQSCQKQKDNYRTACMHICMCACVRVDLCVIILDMCARVNYVCLCASDSLHNNYPLKIYSWCISFFIWRLFVQFLFLFSALRSLFLCRVLYLWQFKTGHMVSQSTTLSSLYQLSGLETTLQVRIFSSLALRWKNLCGVSGDIIIRHLKCPLPPLK